MKPSVYLSVVLTLLPVTAWSEGPISGGQAEQMLKRQQGAELLDAILSDRLEHLAADRIHIENKKVRKCLNDAMDQRASARKRVSDGLLLRGALDTDSRPQDESEKYRRVASQIFYAATRDMEAALSELNKCVSDNASK